MAKYKSSMPMLFWLIFFNTLVYMDTRDGFYIFLSFVVSIFMVIDLIMIYLKNKK